MMDKKIFPWAFILPTSLRRYRNRRLIIKHAPELAYYVHHSARQNFKKTLWMVLPFPFWIVLIIINSILLSFRLLAQGIIQVSDWFLDFARITISAWYVLYQPKMHSDEEWNAALPMEELRARVFGRINSKELYEDRD